MKHLQLGNRHTTVKIIFQDLGNHSTFSTGLVNLKKMQFQIFKVSTFSMSVFFCIVLVIEIAENINYRSFQLDYFHKQNILINSKWYAMPSIYRVYIWGNHVHFYFHFRILLCVKLSQSSTYNTEQKIYLTSIFSWKFQTVNTQDYTLDSLYLVRDIICLNNKSIGDWKLTHSYQYIHIQDFVLILTLCTEDTPSVAKNHRCGFILSSLILFWPIRKINNVLHFPAFA